MDNLFCVICKDRIDNGAPTVRVRKKGSDGINAASKASDDSIIVSPGQTVHKECRRKYCLVADIERHKCANIQNQQSHRTLRSSSEFIFKEHCMFCGQSAKISGNKRGLDVFPVRTTDFQRTVESLCIERSDKWSEQVRGRLEYARDLHAADAIYHQSCNVNFRTGKQTPKVFQLCQEAIKHPRGRPQRLDQSMAFLKVAEYVEDNDDEQITIANLVHKMAEYCSDSKDAYSLVHMKKRLHDHFGTSLIITDIQGKPNVVTLRQTASSILHTFYERPKHNDSKEEQKAIIETAAKLIKSGIKQIQSSKSIYPASTDISSIDKNLEYLPDSLRNLLEIIFPENKSDMKIASIGQAIVQAARPRMIIAPLQIGLGIQMHHHFGSKFLIDTLNGLGFCSSYSEIAKFEVNAASSQGTEIPDVSPGKFLQFVADNVDHNLRTLDGRNTFHGMGIIAGVTPCTKNPISVPRNAISTDDLLSVGKIDIHFFKPVDNALSAMTYEKLPNVNTTDPTEKLDLLSKIMWPIRDSKPGWSGMMQMFQQGQYPGQSSITFLPMIDMNPSDINCVNSTLTYVCGLAKRYGTTPVITFDQPLYMKAFIIINNEGSNSDLKSIVLRLGGFHIEMSFLGCIGHIMSGSGLHEVLETVYASNAVDHMLSGKAVSRAVRGHGLVHTALNAMITSATFNLPLKEPDMTDDDPPNVIEPTSDDEAIADKDIDEATVLYDQLIEGNISLDSLCSKEVFNRIETRIASKKSSLLTLRTSSLWLQYVDMIDLLRSFIKAERTGNWSLHLQSVTNMLPYFAASGHNLYAKSAHVYLQTMHKLEKEHPDVYDLFTSGHHVLRRSDRYWAGLSTDLVIEQSLMRSVKTSGGLTRGRGMTERQRTKWLLAMPACTDINDAMQTFTEVKYCTSDQHKESSRARIERDNKDTRTILSFLQERNPFIDDPSLRNIETGVLADASVNVDNAKEVGTKIINQMSSQAISNYTFRKAHQVVTLSKKMSLKVDGEPIHVNPQLLFQRLLTAANGLFEDVSQLFTFELSSYPSSLFDPSGLLREAQKPALAQAIWAIGDCSTSSTNIEDKQYVIDGGSLLHRIPWPRDNSFASLCNMYVDYITRKYAGHDPIIVFDGYSSNSSTKDVAHARRSKGGIGPKVKFTEDTPCRTKKDLFLANKDNKQSFINMLSAKLNEADYKTVHASGDADLLIVKTAVTSAMKSTTLVIGEDTDLLVLLCFHVDPQAHDVILTSESKQLAQRKRKVWNINKTKTLLGADNCRFLPFIHAITGCDTTSRLFGIGKSVALKRLLNDANFRSQAEVFSKVSCTEDVIKAGEKAIVSLYNGLICEGLDRLRFRIFSRKVTTKYSQVEVKSLPPTSASAKYHSLRVYLQVQNWMDQTQVVLDPLEWGWCNDEDDKLGPIKSHLPAAPEQLLKVVRCNCKSGCDTMRCTCMKHSLQCSPGCGECRGVSCSNSAAICDEDLIDEILPNDETYSI